MSSQVSALTFSVNPQAAASFHDDGVVILHTGTGRLFTANQTGGRIWHGVEQQLPLEAIAKGISDDYQVAPSTAYEHTISFLTALERQVLIHREVAS